MDRETGIEPASSAWKAGVLPLNSSRSGDNSLHCFWWWRRLDSNQRRRKPTDLQSAPFSHSGTPPGKTATIAELFCDSQAPWQLFCRGACRARHHLLEKADVAGAHLRPLTARGLTPRLGGPGGQAVRVRQQVMQHVDQCGGIATGVGG